jgi:predicted CopG family antitoxin
MKTITLSESAYARLKSWKTGHSDSFSSVVERLVPVQGTMGSVLQALDKLKTGTSAQDQKLEEFVSTRKGGGSDPWQ